MSTFTWIPAKASVQEHPRVVSAQFGDGYEQRRPDGINSVVQNWSLFFACESVSVAQEILNFLRARQGVELFYWTPPDAAAPLVFVCREYSGDAEPGARTVSVTFEQVFG